MWYVTEFVKKGLPHIMNLEDHNFIIKRQIKLKTFKLLYVGASCKPHFKSIAFTNLKLWIVKACKMDVCRRPSTWSNISNSVNKCELNNITLRHVLELDLCCNNFQNKRLAKASSQHNRKIFKCLNKTCMLKMQKTFNPCIEII